MSRVPAYSIEYDEPGNFIEVPESYIEKYGPKDALRVYHGIFAHEILSVGDGPLYDIDTETKESGWRGVKQTITTFEPGDATRYTVLFAPGRSHNPDWGGPTVVFGMDAGLGPFVAWEFPSNGRVDFLYFKDKLRYTNLVTAASAYRVFCNLTRWCDPKGEAMEILERTGTTWKADWHDQIRELGDG